VLERKIKDIIRDLSAGPVQEYIREKENFNARDIVLRDKSVLGIPAAQLFEQIASRKKSKEKLPLLYNTPGIIFCPPDKLEQSSSEATGRYKADMIAEFLKKGSSRVADLTGGFGVDSFFISQRISALHYVEPSESLLEIARHNHRLLGADNIRYYLETAEEFLKRANESVDLVYLDPSRRSGDRKVNSLDASHPDVLRLKQAVFEKTTLMFVKASPLLDIHAGISQLGDVRKVFVISVHNECKEILFLCEKKFSGSQSIEAINLADVIERFEFSVSDERQQSVVFSDPLQFLYEPNASILKAGAFKLVASRFDVRKIAANTHLYTSDTYVPTFPGRKFRVETLVKSDRSEMRRNFPGGKANVTTRNYPLTADQLKKKMGLKDGGERFLFGFSGTEKKFLAVANRL
jgi:16S rRNA G966 N2-methylase RsmD